LLAYHLPLDAHETFGNNARLGAVLGLQLRSRNGEQKLLSLGEFPQAKSLENLSEWLQQCLQRRPQIVAGDGREIRNVAWCSGGAQGYFEQAIVLGADAYVTGEISEQCFHLAQESGVAFIAAGHHATERYGIQALGVHLAERFELQHQFFDQDNPV
jgi:putative NIF3 family GTP cyclohydrolase 1 type 2